MGEEKGPAIGSKDWFTYNADKLIDTGLAVLKFKLEGGMTEPDGGANNSNTRSAMGSDLMTYLPWILGGFAVVGVVVLMARR